MNSLGPCSCLAVMALMLGGWFSSAVLAQTSSDDYPPPLDVTAAASDKELEEAISKFWHCEVTGDVAAMEELASVIERTGIEREDPYLQARGLVRRAWADIENGRWKNGASRKLAHARALTAEPPESFNRRAEYVVARAETLLFHGSLKSVFGLPGKTTGEVDLRAGLALSWQTANNDLLFFAHAFAFRAEYLRNRGVTGMFLVVKAEHYAEKTGNRNYIYSARYMRLLAYTMLLMVDSKEWVELIEDTLKNYPEHTSAWRKANAGSTKIDDETISKYIAHSRLPGSEPDFQFDTNRASAVLSQLLLGEVTEDALSLADMMVQLSKEANSEHSLFYCVMKRAEVLFALKKDEEFFAVADKFFPLYMKKGDYFLAARMAAIARIRADESGFDLRSDWKSKAAAANRRLRAITAEQAEFAAEIALQQEESNRLAIDETTVYAQEKRAAILTASRHQSNLERSRTRNAFLGSLALIFLLLGTTTTLFVRSKTLASRQAELEREVKERIRAEERLRTAQQENIRHQRLNALGEMAAGVAHDVNNSLSPICIYSSLMGTEDYSMEEIRQFAGTIQDCVTDATALIQRLHPFYRKSFEERSEVEVAEIVAQVAETARAQLGDRKIVIREEAVSCLFVCSASDIREVLINLTNNAIDAIQVTGQVTIRASLEDEQLTLEVEDDGAGMDQETKANCLYAFFSTKEEHGSGLGLATTNAVVQSYRGRVEIESEIGKGTLLRISLPGAAASELQPEALEEPEVPRECRILVVDDNDATRISALFMLESMGHKVASCPDAAQALQWLSANDVDLLLTDYKMPGMNGFELCKNVHNHYSSLPTIIMSGFEEPGLREACDAILTKPISIAGVQAAIHKAQSAPRLAQPDSNDHVSPQKAC